MKNIFNQIGNAKKLVEFKEVMANDFVRRTPFWSHRAENYKIYEPFMEYCSELDGYLEKLFEGEVDDGNSDMLDNMIMGISRQAEKLLARQRTEHRDVIKSLDMRAKSDRKAFECHLALLREQLEANKGQQEKYRNLIDADEFIQGRKKV